MSELFERAAIRVVAALGPFGCCMSMARKLGFDGTPGVGAGSRASRPELRPTFPARLLSARSAPRCSRAGVSPLLLVLQPGALCPFAAASADVLVSKAAQVRSQYLSIGDRPGAVHDGQATAALTR